MYVCYLLSTPRGRGVGDSLIPFSNRWTIIGLVSVKVNILKGVDGGHWGGGVGLSGIGSCFFFQLFFC